MGDGACPGGRLAKLSNAEEMKLKVARPEESMAAWCFRFLQELPNVKMELSGISNLELHYWRIIMRLDSRLPNHYQETQFFRCRRILDKYYIQQYDK